MKELLGGKGANLAEMTAIGIPVPFGFTISTEACEKFYKNNRQFPVGLIEEIDLKIKDVEEKMGAELGDPSNPLLISVRSGAAVSMPGMMDTVLNLGMNKDVVNGLIVKTGNPRFVWDSYRRFIQMFGDVVLNMEHKNFENVLEQAKEHEKVHFDTELSAEALKWVANEYLELVRKSGHQIPDDPRLQLKMAIEAVFGSWNNSRAVLYRKLNSIRGLKGTAVNVQAMVFGNMGETSGTGVCFTRDPATGENVFYGEYLMNAQGEDVVAGIRTPQAIANLRNVNNGVFEELVAVREKLEQHYKDMQDVEFTIQEGKLFILQTRTGKRTAAAAVRCAVDMVKEGLIDKKTAVMRVQPNALDQLLHKQLDVEATKKHKPLAKGLAASPGAATGAIVFDAEKAHEWAQQGAKVILVRNETSPEDLIGMNAAQGILTSRGGMTSHAAVVARGMGKCCVAGCSAVKVFERQGFLEVGGITLKEGDFITLNGSTGEVYQGELPTVEPELTGHFKTLMSWADEFRRLRVRANADVPHDAQVAVSFGAEGIGLCRTEHMFFNEARILAMREMIMANTLQNREKALEKLLPYQKEDFKGLFEAMGNRPVTIRLLDPPLHEFLPQEAEEKEELATSLNISLEQIEQTIAGLQEQNPMLGHRGCRLGITYPEITAMQTRAIIEAALEVNNENLRPEIMIPLVGTVSEYINQRDIVKSVADTLIKASGKKLHYLVGTMIEIPRAALTAFDIGREADFFSFGTNDLTQMTYGFSRDDIASFIPEYIDKGILAYDPFEILDQEGVGQLVSLAVQNGRIGNPELHIGICGEHGGEPQSVEFFHREGLDYVSCSPYRVPIARLAAAQAALK